MTPQALLPTSLPVAKTLDFLDPVSDGSDLFFLTVNATGLASTAKTQQKAVQLPIADDFYWYLSTLQADISGAGVAAAPITESGILVPLVNIVVRDESSRKNLANLTFPVAGLFGTGERPCRLVNPRKIRGGTVMSFEFTAIVAAGTTYTNLFLTLHGITLPAGSLP